MSRANEPIHSSRAGSMFYIPGEHSDDIKKALAERIDAVSGLTIREHFAAMAMQGWLAKNGTDNYANGHLSCATESVRWADALITELAKPVTP